MKRFKAKVIAGQGRGREIGFPTANLDRTDLDIDHGVYSALAYVNGQKYAALLHFGPKKTFAEGISSELHIKDFDLDIYDQEIEVEIVGKIREIKRFKNIEELKEQISKDLELI